MIQVKLRHGDRVLICDGRKALILENNGDGERIDLRVKDKRERRDAPTAAQGTDAPGRVHASVGGARSAVEQTDWHDREEELFLRSLAEELNGIGDGLRRERVVVIAPPRALAVLRASWSPLMQKAIVAEIHKDLVRTPVNEIEAMFAGAAAA